MGVREYLSSLFPNNRASETDSDAPQLGKDLGMHLLYDGTKAREDQLLGEEEEDNQPCLEPVDIVAVHGLEGHAIKTWLHPESKVMWLQSLLSVAMPKSRIMSYGYDANIYKSRSTLHIMDNAADILSEIQAKRTSQTLQSRRIIFIGHSMGGIIIKKALNMAREEKQYHGILQSTVGIMFMGTSHDGADGAKLASTAADIANSVMELNTYQLRTLKSGSEQLQDISRSFGYHNDLRIVTVIESDKTEIRGIRTLIVSQASARLNLGDPETVLSVSGADHHMVCKFRGEDDKQYHKIKIAIIGLAASPVASKSPDVIEHHKRLRSIDESINERSAKLQRIVNEGFDDTKSSLAALDINSNTQENNMLKDSMLRVLSPLADHAKKHIEKTPSTGLTFLQTTEYQDWKTGPASFLWLHGKSGTGKTVLFSTITEDISEYCASGIGSSAAAAVYCSWSDQDIASLIATLLTGFICKLSKVPQDLSRLVEKCQSSTNGEADLSQALHCILTHLDSAYIMIDGLDEWPLENGRRSSLLEWIAKLDGWNFPHLHVLLTSQHLPDIKETLSDKCALRIDSRPDILIHVGHELRTDQQLARFDSSLKTEIKQVLLDGSDEGFRWVALQLMELKSCFTSKDVREALRTLPKTLTETYDKILDSVHERNQPYVRAALRWIACSARPLSLDELAVAAVVDPTVAIPHGNENQLIGGGETIHKMLSKLIDVQKVEHVSLMDYVENNGRSAEQVCEYFDLVYANLKIPGPTIVKFSHSSVRDYLLQRHDDADVSRSFSFSEDMAHRFIAESCWAYFQSIPAGAREDDKAYPASWVCLLEYLLSHWHTHAVRLPDEEPGSLVHLINEPRALRFFMLAKDEYEDLDRKFATIVGWERSQMKPLSPEQTLQYAACIGCSHLLDSILASNPNLDVNASSEYVQTALSLACERRHWPIVDTLLKRGADPNKQVGVGGVPLVDASEYGADDIVQKLISHGADVNIFCRNREYDDTPLTAAIAAGHPSTVELLLINGADPNESSGTPLFVAAEHDRHECMEILLEHEASLEVLGIWLPSPLEKACASGFVETVKLLLTRNVDVDGENYLKPLQLDTSPDSTYRFDYPTISFEYYHVQSYGSPMHAAAAYGKTEILKLLVQHNAAVNERSHYWETPSTLARLRGHKEALEYLLSQGGVALEQTEVCYRQDHFKESGVSGEVLKFCGVYDDDEDGDNEGDDVVSNDSDAMED